MDPDCSAKVIRANPQGRRRHSSETFSSAATATVTPVFPSFARADAVKRHSSVENISSRSSEGSDEEYGSPVNKQTTARMMDAAFPRNGMNYLALLENRDVEKREELVGFKTTAASSCKGVVNGLHSSPYVCLGFKEAATTAKGESPSSQRRYRAASDQYIGLRNNQRFKLMSLGVAQGYPRTKL